MITILDYGMGNVGSIVNMLKKLRAVAVVSSTEADVRRATNLILPGVGAFDKGMTSLRERGLIEILNEKVLRQRTPVLGICLGMQLFCRSSEEGVLLGLGWLKANAVRFNFGRNHADLKIPHMGWNTVSIAKTTRLFRNVPEPARFYFVHSYHVVCEDPRDILTTTVYGAPFASSVERDNIIGVQFHPEKSHRFGLQVMSNFLGLC